MWNQGTEKYFRRNECPICGAKIPRDLSPSWDTDETCPNDKMHYRWYDNLYGTIVRVLSQRFDARKINEIEEYLDEVGNHKFKGV